MAPPPGVRRATHCPHPHCAVHRMLEAFTGNKDSNCVLPSLSLWGKVFLGGVWVWVWGCGGRCLHLHNVTLSHCYNATA